jgi:hypothetical protein
MVRTATEYAKLIRAQQSAIDRALREINKLVEEAIPDFHWLDYRVSTFWSCDESPIGVCVFHLDDRGHPTQCRYCGGPTTRK